MVQRVTYRRRLSYNTRSNRRKIVRSPGGRLTFQYLKKRHSVPKCPQTGLALKGVKPSRPADRSRLSLRQKKVYRAYGGKTPSLFSLQIVDGNESTMSELLYIDTHSVFGERTKIRLFSNLTDLGKYI